MGLLQPARQGTELQAGRQIAPDSESPDAGCRHCGLPVPSGTDHPGFCCRGCLAVHDLIQGAGLKRFYELGGGQPVGDVPAPSRRAWLEELERASVLSGDQVRVHLDVQGLHCAACVWLLEELWRRQEGALRILLNPSLGQVELVYDRSLLALDRYLDDAERLGYRMAPASKRSAAGDRGLLVRMGVCVALALNAMLFALAEYLGMTEADGPGFALFRGLSLALAVAAVVIGGPVFFRGALAGLRQRVLHLDLPISLGILLAFGGSVACAITGWGDSYFDTVTVFVALMLVGRYLQSRALHRNRDYLLANDGAEHLRVRRRRGDDVETVQVTSIAAGDRLLLAPGDLVPVRARLVRDTGSFSLDWINGESMPRAFVKGAEVPAGAFVASRAPVEVVAVATAEESGLLRLLSATQDRDQDLRGHGRFWLWVNRGYVAVVLLLAALAGITWWLVDASRALEVMTAVLVVTCPCALGLATPLAFEMALARLRRAGIYVRNATLLEKARHVSKVIFDKTGTLTWGRQKAQVLRDVQGETANVLFTMVEGSNHPVSRGIARALRPRGPRFLGELRVEELAGKGLQATYRGVVYRLGSPAFVFDARTRSDDDVCLFTRDGHVEAVFAMEEDVRGGFRTEISGLRDRGYEVHLLSGDVQRKVDRVAEDLGISRGHALGGLSPEAKSRAIRRLDAADTMMVGDGLNDAPAFDAALCAGTPALDSPVMPARSDFYFRGEGAGAVSGVLGTARKLHRVITANLALAVVYNAVVLPLCFAGLMSPLLCAVLMPLSSLLLIGHTALRLGPRPVEAAA